MKKYFPPKKNSAQTQNMKKKLKISKCDKTQKLKKIHIWKYDKKSKWDKT